MLALVALLVFALIAWCLTRSHLHAGPATPDEPETYDRHGHLTTGRATVPNPRREEAEGDGPSTASSRCGGRR